MPGISKKHGLVLIHGLANRHRWSRGFIKSCLDHWGSGQVFVMYLNKSSQVALSNLDGRRITYIGENDHRAGCGTVAEQAGYMAEKTDILQEYGLGRNFYIIAHSMGGLVSRHYIYHHPSRAAGLVTLGTPHHGSPLADSYNWLGRLAGSQKAMDNLTPRWAAWFNRQCPVKDCRLYAGGNIYTLRGFSRGLPWEMGSFGELFIGWHHLRWIYGTSSDGMVPDSSSLIEGAVHLADLPGCTHQDLVRNTRIVEICSRVLI